MTKKGAHLFFAITIIRPRVAITTPPVPCTIASGSIGVFFNHFTLMTLRTSSCERTSLVTSSVTPCLPTQIVGFNV